MFDRLFVLFEFGLDDLVQLHKGLDEFLPDLSLYLPSSIIDPKVVHLFLPQPIGIDLVKDVKGDLELIHKNIAQFILRYLNPKTTVSLLLVIFLQQTIKVLETYLTDTLHCR